MVYLRNEWIINPQNITVVRELLSDLKQDIKTENSKTEGQVIDILENLGETKIVDMLKDGFVF